jgi:predicted nucleic acid-binding protein
LSKIWVLDASSLIILGKLSFLNILNHLCGELIIPNGVVEEILRGTDNDKAKVWLLREGKKYQKNTGLISSKIASWDLGLGENEVLSYCYSNSQYVAIIDDKAAKKCANTFSIKTKGTLSIIMTAKKAGLIPEVKPVLNQMIEAGFRIKDSLYRKVIEIANER